MEMGWFRGFRGSVIDIVKVYNEEQVLDSCVYRLNVFLNVFRHDIY